MEQLGIFDLIWPSFGSPQWGFWQKFFWKVKCPTLTTASSCMEDRRPGFLGASTEISQPLDSETLPWPAIPATRPWAPTSSHPGTCHTELNSGKREGGGGGRKKTGRITPSSATKTTSIRHAETRYNAGGHWACPAHSKLLTAWQIPASLCS